MKLRKFSYDVSYKETWVYSFLYSGDATYLSQDDLNELTIYIR